MKNVAQIIREVNRNMEMVQITRGIAQFEGAVVPQRYALKKTSYGPRFVLYLEEIDEWIWATGLVNFLPLSPSFCLCFSLFPYLINNINPYR